MGGDVVRGLLVVDVQNDFCEGGALGVAGGTQVAARITNFIAAQASDYAAIVASKDWPDADNDTGGHFAPEGEAPNFVTTWPVHCVAGTTGAEYHPELTLPDHTLHVKKGQGVPSYSMFEGRSDDGQSVEEILRSVGVTEVDVVGIATDHCVRASALDARGAGFQVRVLNDLIAAVSPDTERSARTEMIEAGVFFADN
jgi:nicotinamidase/pyrazinamidase